MRYLMTIRADKNTKTGMPPDPKLMAAIGALGEQMKKEGKLLATGGLAYSMPSTRITLKGAQLTLTDGPFPETKELIAGFALFELASKEEAIEQGKRFMKLHSDILGPTYEGTMEIHDVFGG